MTTEIDPCAFCGEYDGECAISGVQNLQGKRKFAVYCNGCFSEGPPAETKEEAIEAWNTRSPTTAASGVVQALFGFERSDLAYLVDCLERKHGDDVAHGSTDAAARFIRAALASREAPEPTEAQKQQVIAQFLERTGQYVTNDASREDAIKRAVDAALASPQVAPAPIECDDHCFFYGTGMTCNECEGATPVQVAPNPSPSPASVLTDEQIINNIENAMNMERGLWHLVSCGELVSLFRKHLAIQGEVK